MNSRGGFRGRNIQVRNKRFVRTNTQIRAAKIRLIDQDGNQVGVVSREEGIASARAVELDLVEVVAHTDPPVCRIIDFNRYKYEQDKRERQARKSAHVTEQKEVRFSPVISEHDYNFKKEQVAEFLKEGHRVKVQVRFRGRQIVHTSLGRELLDRLARDLAALGSVERDSRMIGRQIDIIIRPV